MPFETAYISSLPSGVHLPAAPRQLSILGATGSIGDSALRLAAAHPEAFSVCALAGGRNVARLAELATRFRPAHLAILTPELAEELARLLPAGYRPHILTGVYGYEQLASLPEADVVLSAMVGAAGLQPTLAAARAGKIIALANKESLVLAGDLIHIACRDSGAVVLPVDSEHNAIFQALAGHHTQGVRRLILTASGGPFRGRRAESLADVTPEDALKHPSWSMGAKISIDSATLMNKALEVIEAWRLFGAPPERIEVLVHPQSIVHSLVEFDDGSQLAHLGPPDMRIPIAYCLAWPERLPLLADGDAPAGETDALTPLDLAAVGQLTFERPDTTVFPCLEYAYEVIRQAMPAGYVALNAANEAAVQLFLERRIPFPAIAQLIRRSLDAVAEEFGPMDLASRLKLDEAVRRQVIAWTDA